MAQDRGDIFVFLKRDGESQASSVDFFFWKQVIYYPRERNGHL